MLSARALTMTYPGVRALAGVDFDLRAGEIHALCGENGAGKSTLIKILSGIIPHGRYGGHVDLAGSSAVEKSSEAKFSGPGDALRAGIRVIHQELALCPDFTVAENVFLGEEPLLPGLPAALRLIDTARAESETRRELDKLGLSGLDPRAVTGTLPVGIRQMVEIARALRSPSQEGFAGARILILDEPTSALSTRESERLEETLKRLREQGLAILYISHRLDEVFRLADRITVLRNGETRGTLERSTAGAPFDPDRVVALMVGGALDSDTGARFLPSVDGDGSPAPANTVSPRPAAEPPLLSVRDWTVRAPENAAKNTLENISFDLRAGEILGLCGLMGAGRTELVESLCGLFPARGRGEIELEGKPYAPRDARHAHARGIALVCEDRRGHGIMPEKSVRANLTYASLRLFCSGLPGLRWILREERERRAAKSQVEALRVKTPDVDFPIGNLSGGNQQKALIGRALLTSPRILILDEPTRGIDVGAKAEIYTLIHKLAAGGMGILLISSEHGEALRLSHRVLVLRNGKVAALRDKQDITEQEILALASGGTP